jgi:dTDP-4-amino-4,6-dideoxygalactose transaminase
LGDLGCFSFNGNKLVTTGGGGMIVTDRQDLAERARYLTTQARDDSVEYIHNEIGYNYRLTNIQAALGVAQMEQIEEFLTKKRDIAQAYEEAFPEIHGVTPMPCQPGTEPAYWLYTALLPDKTTIEERKAVIEDLNGRGIGARPLFHPLHSLPPYAQCQAFQIETADALYRRGVSLPSSVGLTEMEQMRCIDSLKEVLKNNDSAGTPS